MPTGFTARLYDGEQEFKDFVRNAARGMGAFMHLREESWDKPLTYPEDDSPRRLQGFKESLRDNTRWRLSTEEEKYQWWSEYYTNAVWEAEQRDVSEFLERRDRFDRMTEQVANTEVPEKLESFKEFMLQQLGTEFQHRREPYVYTPLEYVEWCEHETEWRQRREDMDRKYFREARTRYREVCEYIDLLAETFGFEVDKG